ncbi:MAG: Gfo/Idh/MocA family oxidoreductase [Planctomycetes bacterium]|nr:Gfo/Idh/MocA family oxidoreductase [Planctomycetota bacterium]
MAKKTYRPTRRQFLAGSCAAIAAPYLRPSAVLGAGGRPPPSERIVVGAIGLGSRGSGNLGAFLGRGDVQCVAVCDVRKNVREARKSQVDGHNKNQDCKAYNDFRELLARKDIDAVLVATPDHWHTIIVVEACRSGKDVYCEKPETLTLAEGPMMVEAARRYGRVVSGGSQRVLGDYRGIVDKCWKGELGPIQSINVNVGPLSQPCNLPAEPVPEGMDWDMWLGPAPWAPYNGARASGSYATGGGSWRSYKDYSGGGMTDWGAHHFGGATFAVDVRELQPEEVLYKQANGAAFLTFRYPNGILIHHNHPGRGNLDVEGTPGEKRAPKPIPSYGGNESSIYGDFIHCVKTRGKPFRDIEYAINTMSLCHLGIVAYELKRSLKWDAARQEFPGDAEANRFLDRARREPWVL